MPIALRLVILLAIGVATMVIGRRKNKDALVYGGGVVTTLAGSSFLAFTAATIL